MQEERKNVVEYSITSTGSVLMFVVIGEKENGRHGKTTRHICTGSSRL